MCVRVVYNTISTCKCPLSFHMHLTATAAHIDPSIPPLDPCYLRSPSTETSLLLISTLLRLFFCRCENAWTVLLFTLAFYLLLIRIAPAQVRPHDQRGSCGQRGSGHAGPIDTC